VVIGVGIATLLTLPLRNLAPNSLGLFFIAAVILNARYGGTWAGLASAVLSMIVFDLLFDEKPFHLDLNLPSWIRLLFFCSFSLLVSSLEKQRKSVMRSLRETNQTLQHALDEVKTLRGILPICVYCKQVRTAEGDWVQMEKYVHEHTHADFSHGMCPECYKKNYPEIYKQNNQTS
jgi:K+-sensing histidine kinase KdpD